MMTIDALPQYLARVAEEAAEEFASGHHGTGDLGVTIRNIDHLDRAKPLIQKSFEEN